MLEKFIKALMSVSAAYLNAIPGKGIHVVTVNDYLASRDAEWMRPIFSYLGLTVGTILSDMDKARRKEHYARNITWGTNNEFGFDYLRDNPLRTFLDLCYTTPIMKSRHYETSVSSPSPLARNAARGRLSDRQSCPPPPR